METMSLLLFMVGLLLCQTNGSYHALTDSSGTSSYIAHISTLSTESLDLTLYHHLSYSASPICSDCVLFNGSLKTYAIPIDEHAISFYIEYNPILKTHHVYLFVNCPLSLTISIALPSHRIQYTQTQVTHHQPNTDCVFEQQSDENTPNMIHYLVYNTPNHIQLFQYHAPLQSHQLIQRIHTPFNTSSIPYIVYCNRVLYVVYLSNEHRINTLHIGSYHAVHQTWTSHDHLFNEVQFNSETVIQSIGIHDKKPKHTIPMLNILFVSHSNTKYDILSWLIDTNIYSIHEYQHNMNSEPIMINDYSIGFILSGPIRDIHEFIYYDNINDLLQHLSFNTQSSANTRRRLAKTDPECQDVSANCAHIAKDCDDDIGIANICRATCGQCEQRAFNCSDYHSSGNGVDVCQFPRETPSFCADPDGWFEYFCPITCHHPNCTQYWITANPTPSPTIMTTVFESTELDVTTDKPSIAHTVSTMDEISTSQSITSVTKDDNNNNIIQIPITHKPNDMSLILILLAVLLLCILMASVLLWICVNIVRLQKDKNYISYNSVAAMYTRTPDFYTHAGCAPSTPDYYTTELHPQQVRRGAFQRG
eukprot:467744_1